MELPPSSFPDTRPVGVATGVPWEQRARGFFDRYVAQLLRLTVSPVGAGRELAGPAPTLGPAFTFSAIAGLTAYLPTLLCLPCVGILFPTIAALVLPPEVAAVQGALICGAIASAPFIIVLVHFISDLAFAGVFHACALVAGGRAPFAQSLRAVLYARGTTTWLIVIWLFAWIPFIGTALQLAVRTALLVWSGFTLFGAAQGVHQLAEDRAVLVAIGTIVGGVLLFGSLLAGAVALASTLMAGTIAGLGQFDWAP